MNRSRPQNFHNAGEPSLRSLGNRRSQIDIFRVESILDSAQRRLAGFVVGSGSGLVNHAG